MTKSDCREEKIDDESIEKRHVMEICGEERTEVLRLTNFFAAKGGGKQKKEYF
ncbi:MAG: hypothetical protein MJZ98_07060 [Paludibacteraceae bacterium]|nr:hypothetical protein [Paludibacteraceae bacterium]